VSQCLAGDEPGLAGYWRFEERTGVTANDSSTNVNTGALVNGVLWANATAPLACGDLRPYLCLTATDRWQSRKGSTPPPSPSRARGRQRTN